MKRPHFQEKRSLRIILSLALFASLLFIRTRAQEAATNSEKWNFIVYITASNTLYKFARPNIEQMERIGSGQHVNILVQLDELGKKEVSRFFIEHGKSTLVEKKINAPESLSGTPESLFDFARWAISTYKADHHAIILWNHGSGVKDPLGWNKTMRGQQSDLFYFNPQTGLFELNRTLLRGIAFNDSFSTYLTNDDLGATLEKISRDLLGGKKIDLVGMDACHMSMIEIGSQIKHAASFMVGSQEIEPGQGWDYSRILAPLKTSSLSPLTLSQHIVRAYQEQYQYRFGDFTQSALSLDKYEELEKSMDAVTAALQRLSQQTGPPNIIKTISRVRNNPHKTTVFLDRDYIDLYHFLSSLKKEVDAEVSPEKQSPLVAALCAELAHCNKLLDQHIIQNATGKNLPGAHGLSIYFPTRTIYPSYYTTTFSHQTQWCNFLQRYLKQTLEESKKIK